MQKNLQASVIVSTYNWPKALECVLWGLFFQNRRDFEIVIADDGSSVATRELIQRMAYNAPVSITHVWQRDDGFNKCRALNKALAVSRGERVIFTDGDCVVRKDFVDVHLRMSSPGKFLSGSYYKLPVRTSTAVDKSVIASQEVFSAAWLLRNGVEINAGLLKILAKGRLARLLDAVSTARPSWNGHSASCLRDEAIAVNGFNEDMGYGGLDVEFGLRLNSHGLKVKRIRYATLALHLHHERPYNTSGMRQASQAVKERTRDLALKWADRGLDQWLGSGGEVRLSEEDCITRFEAN
ncbi:MAG: glycosyltransferase [Allorhizobium sp.]